MKSLIPFTGAFHGDEMAHFTDSNGFYPVKVKLSFNCPPFKSENKLIYRLQQRVEIYQHRLNFQDGDDEFESFGVNFATALVNFIKNGYVSQNLLREIVPFNGIYHHESLFFLQRPLLSSILVAASH